MGRASDVKRVGLPWALTICRQILPPGLPHEKLRNQEETREKNARKPETRGNRRKQGKRLEWYAERGYDSDRTKWQLAWVDSGKRGVRSCQNHMAYGAPATLRLAILATSAYLPAHVSFARRTRIDGRTPRRSRSRARRIPGQRVFVQSRLFPVGSPPGTDSTDTRETALRLLPQLRSQGRAPRRETRRTGECAARRADRSRGNGL